MDINNFITITNVIDSLVDIHTKYIDAINFIKINYKKSINEADLNQIIEFIENSLKEDFEKNTRFQNGNKKDTFLDLENKLKKLKEVIYQS